MKVFNFEPEEFYEEYARKGFVHIPGGVAPGFIDYALTFARDALARQSETSLTEWTFRNKKKQFLFDFPERVDFHGDLKCPVANLAGLRGKVTLCERHIKVYDDTAPATPPPHKDRVASEVTVGIPLQVPENSYIVLYPHHQRDINPFATAALYRSSLAEDNLPELTLADVDPEILRVWPGDVVFFEGSSMYHERVNPANTLLLYLKFNSMNLDPLAEDPSTGLQREVSLRAIQDLDDSRLLQSRVMVSPRLERISRHYSRLYWKEILQIYIWNEKEITIDEYQLGLIKGLGHERLRVFDLLRRNGVGGPDFTEHLNTARRLIRLGALDLVLSEEEVAERSTDRSTAWQRSQDHPR